MPGSGETVTAPEAAALTAESASSTSEVADEVPPQADSAIAAATADEQAPVERRVLIGSPHLACASVARSPS